MKVFRNGCVIAEISDIKFLGKLPQYATSELKYYYEPEEVFEVFKNEKSVAFFRQKEEIIDYDYISSLTNEEIEQECLKLNAELERRYKIYYESSTAMRIKYDRNREYNEKNRSIIYKLKKMEDYLKHRNEYDETFKIFDEDEITKENEESGHKLVFENNKQ